jgi:hypothetical protein
MATVTKAKRGRKTAGTPKERPGRKPWQPPEGTPPRLEHETLHSYQYFCTFWQYWELGADIDCSGDKKARSQFAYDSTLEDYKAANPKLKSCKAFHSLYRDRYWQARVEGKPHSPLEKQQRLRDYDPKAAAGLTPEQLQAKLDAIARDATESPVPPPPPQQQAPEPDLKKVAREVVDADVAGIRQTIPNETVVFVQILDRALELEMGQINRLRQQLAAALECGSLHPICPDAIGIPTADGFLGILRAKLGK